MKKTIGMLCALVLLLCGFAGCSADPDNSLLTDTGDYSSRICTDGE